jgi:hypothetical protein
MGQIVSVSPMKSIDAASFIKEGWKQLLLCPNCQVRGITLGLSWHSMLFAQCLKCRHLSEVSETSGAFAGRGERSSPARVVYL